MLKKLRHIRNEAVYKSVALVGLCCTAAIFCIMMAGGLAMRAVAGIGYRLSA